jgi:TDG/mug DNA glycosylase family protein
MLLAACKRRPVTAIMTITAGFPPIAAPSARVLILGSLPSQLSLTREQYYGNPQNAFWRIMGVLFDAGPDLQYEERTTRLKEAGIAVWDVLRSSRRPGSMDADIDEEASLANDFSSFLQNHARLELVCFNGQKAARLYERLVMSDPGADFSGLRYENLPSTSPAYAAMNFAAKLERWSIIVR